MALTRPHEYRILVLRLPALDQPTSYPKLSFGGVATNGDVFNAFFFGTTRRTWYRVSCSSLLPLLSRTAYSQPVWTVHDMTQDSGTK